MFATNKDRRLQGTRNPMFEGISMGPVPPERRLLVNPDGVGPRVAEQKSCAFRHSLGYITP